MTRNFTELFMYLVVTPILFIYFILKDIFIRKK